MKQKQTFNAIIHSDLIKLPHTLKVELCDGFEKGDYYVCSDSILRGPTGDPVSWHIAKAFFYLGLLPKEDAIFIIQSTAVESEKLIPQSLKGIENALERVSFD